MALLRNLISGINRFLFMKYISIYLFYTFFNLFLVFPLSACDELSEKVQEFDVEFAERLKSDFPEEPMKIPHKIWAEVWRIK